MQLDAGLATVVVGLGAAGGLVVVTAGFFTAVVGTGTATGAGAGTWTTVVVVVGVGVVVVVVVVVVLVVVVVVVPAVLETVGGAAAGEPQAVMVSNRAPASSPKWRAATWVLRGTIMVGSQRLYDIRSCASAARALRYHWGDHRA
ncbi:hypothetical protein GCM10010483_61570 [Actinokineospora diospyrosa]